MRGIALLAGLLLASLATRLAAADLTVGYLALEDDDRYLESRLEARYRGQPTGRPLDGAKVALREAKFVGKAIGIEFGLHDVEVETPGELLTALEAMVADGIHFVLLDLPADQVAELAAATSGMPVLLFNVTSHADRLRNADCQAHLLHPLPSHAMRMDALAQYLVARKWREILLLEGPTAGDRELADAFRRSVKRYGLELVDTRPFLLSNDPRERERGNVKLLTARGDYDLVFVADSEGEFARGVPFQMSQPRPVIGSEGLVPGAWHWGWERHGAPQLNSRFRKHAKRDMTATDWAAWVAVKSVVEAAVRTESSDFATVAAYLRGETIVIDGFKGNPLSYRPWNGQLRQPILLGTHNWIAARAPIEGFLHPTHKLDTLGFDARESRCEAGY